MEKALIAVGAVVGGILFVVAMLGMMTLSVYLGVVALVLGICALIVGGLLRLAEAQIRMVVFYSAVGTLFAVAAIWLACAGHGQWALWGVFLGALVGLAMFLKNASRFTERLADESSRKEYVDGDGTTHKYVVVGYRDWPAPLNERPIYMLLAVLCLFVAVVLIAYAAPRYNETREALASAAWSFGCGFLAACTLVSLYTVMNEERKAGIELFSQYLPLGTTAQLAGCLAKKCPQPWQSIKEVTGDICEAVHRVGKVSVRWDQ